MSLRRHFLAPGERAGYMLSAFAVISYASNRVYALFAAVGAWIGGFLSVTALT